jgi:hypothetical protein
VSVEDICGIQAIRGQILFEFRISFGFQISLVLECWSLMLFNAAFELTCVGWRV